jgi:hypothetical protein
VGVPAGVLSLAMQISTKSTKKISIPY